MSIIRIKGRADPIFVDYQIAKYVKQRKFGDPNTDPPIAKATPDALCDLGDVWAGEYRKISDIELNDKPRPKLIEPPAEPITDAERAEGKAVIKRIGDELREKGILKSQEKIQQMELNRSALEEYQRVHGRPYTIPFGVKIIEDVAGYIQSESG